MQKLSQIMQKWYCQPIFKNYILTSSVYHSS